jgi:hypothetical protein
MKATTKALNLISALQRTMDHTLVQAIVGNAMRLAIKRKSRRLGANHINKVLEEQYADAKAG